MLAILQVTEKGLTGEQHRQRLEEYGPNKLPEGTRNPILVYLGCVTTSQMYISPGP